MIEYKNPMEYDYYLEVKAGKHREYLPDGGLFPDVYIDRIYPEDLPEWYVHCEYNERQGYLTAKGVVDIIYEPSDKLHGLLEEDKLIVSFEGKIVKHGEDLPLWRKYEGMSYWLTGVHIINYLRAVRVYSSFDVSGIMAVIRARRTLLAQSKEMTDYYEKLDPDNHRAKKENEDESGELQAAIQTVNRQGDEG